MVTKIANVGASQSLLKLFAKQEPITQAEEKQLIYDAQNGNENAIEKLILVHGRFCVKFAKRYTHVNVQFSDILSECILGMLHAIQSFDSSKNIKFLTHAGWWMRQYVFRYLYGKLSQVRLPESYITSKNKVLRAEEKFIQENGYPPSEEELNEILNIGKKNLHFVMNTNLNISPDSDMCSSIEDEEPDDRISKIYEFLDTKSTDIEKEVVEYSFGLNNKICLPDSEIAKIVHVPIKQIKFIRDEVLSEIKNYINSNNDIFSNCQ